MMTTITVAVAAANRWISNPANTPLMRSCWDCEPAHQHLRQADYVFFCAQCGHWFFQGQDITRKEVRPRMAELKYPKKKEASAKKKTKKAQPKASKKKMGGSSARKGC